MSPIEVRQHPTDDRRIQFLFGEDEPSAEVLEFIKSIETTLEKLNRAFPDDDDKFKKRFEVILEFAAASLREHEPDLTAARTRLDEINADLGDREKSEEEQEETKSWFRVERGDKKPPNILFTPVDDNAEVPVELAKLQINIDRLLGALMPIVEAMALGVPVICSDIPAHRESAQERAEFFDPLDETAWHRAVLRLIEDDGAVEAARARQAGYAPPSWGEHFRLLEAELEGLLQNGEPRTPVDHLTGGGRLPLRHGGDRAQVPDTL